MIVFDYDYTLSLWQMCREVRMRGGVNVEVCVCRLSDLIEKKPFTVDCYGIEVGLILAGGEVRAYENRCPHRGGPVCLGSVFSRVRVELDDVKRAVKEYVSEDEDTLVCPWHGFEFDLDTGECTADKNLKLRKLGVRIQGENVYINVAERHRAETGLML